MRYFIILLFCCCSALFGAEEEKNSRLSYYTNLEDALQEAIRVDKPIFFNCYAGWSGPSRLMDSVVLADPQLVAFVEEHCVPLRVDMIKTQEGRRLAEKYGVKFFAHFLILNPQGEILHRIVGGSKAPEFLERLKRGLNPETSLRGLNQRYERGERGLEFLAAYAEVLNEADETERFKEVADYYLKHADTLQLYSPQAWKMLYKRGMRYGSEWFDFIYEHRTELIRENGEQVTEFIVQSAFQKIFPYMMLEKNEDRALLEEIKGKLETLDTAFYPRKQLLDICEILILRQEKKYADMLDIWEKCMVNFPNPLVEWKFDITLGLLQDMEKAEKERAATFLSAKLQGMTGDQRTQYQHAVEQLRSYQGIVFETGSLKDALEKARQSGKALFVDCYTSWCGPCQMMSKRVFPQKQVGDFMNPFFISIKIDMEKGEGIELAKRWRIDSYPTYLVLNAQGEVVYTSRGYVSTEEFIKRMKEGLTNWKQSINK